MNHQWSLHTHQPSWTIIIPARSLLLAPQKSREQWWRMLQCLGIVLQLSVWYNYNVSNFNHWDHHLLLLTRPELMYSCCVVCLCAHFWQVKPLQNLHGYWLVDVGDPISLNGRSPSPWQTEVDSFCPQYHKVNTNLLLDDVHCSMHDHKTGWVVPKTVVFPQESWLPYQELRMIPEWSSVEQLLGYEKDMAVGQNPIPLVPQSFTIIFQLLLFVNLSPMHVGWWIAWPISHP